MEEKNYIKMIEEQGCGALQKVPLKFFDDEDFIDCAILANEKYAKSRMAKEKVQSVKNVIQAAERCHFEDVMEVKMAERQKYWEREIDRDDSKIKKLPFNLVGDEDFLSKIRINFKSFLDLAERYEELDKYENHEEAKKKLYAEFEVLISERKKDRKEHWENLIKKDNRNIYYLPFDLVFDGDFRNNIYSSCNEEQKEVVGALINERINDAKLVEKQKEAQHKYIRGK